MIEKIKIALNPPPSYQEIATRLGVSRGIVAQYFSEKARASLRISDELSDKIEEAAIQVIKERAFEMLKLIAEIKTHPES